jgi:hypothetical protein
MTNHKSIPNDEKVGGTLFEELAFKHLAKKYDISKEDILALAANKKNLNESIPVSIIRTLELSSLEAIVKFLRENRNKSYKIIGTLLNRNHKTLAVTYAVAIRKKPELFSKEREDDSNRIPFTAFNNDLSILESICTYLKSIDYSYADIARMINKDQRTVWTVCHRAKIKSQKKSDLQSKHDTR